MEEIEFIVGETYENMKGLYEVLSIDGENMRIRWESGEEITTEIDFQRRVIERMKQEEQILANKKKAAKKKSKTSRNRFEGFTEGDFSGQITGTTWRRRTGLGGAVSLPSSGNRLNIKSWSVARKPMIEWADVKHRKGTGNNLQSKFFASLDQDQLHFGFSLERSKSKPGAEDECEAFLGWLEDQENEKWLKELAESENLTLTDEKNEGVFPGKLISKSEKWCFPHDEDSPAIESLSKFLNEIFTNSQAIELHISKSIPKDQVLDAGEKIADIISSLFKAMIPLYENIVFH
jgi:hypothetical protein